MDPVANAPKTADDVLDAMNADFDADFDASSSAPTEAAPAPVEAPPAERAIEGSPSPVEATAAPEKTTEVESPSTAAAPTETTAPQYSEQTLNLLKKYGGDGTGGEADKQAIAKAADHYWELTKQNAELASRPTETTPAPKPAEAAPAAGTETPAEPEYPQEVVGYFDQRMTELADDYDGKLEVLKQIDVEIAEAVKSIRTAEPYDEAGKAAAATKLLELQDKRGGVIADAKKLRAEHAQQKQLRQQSVNLFTLSQEATRVREAEAQAEEAGRETRFWTTWDGEVAKVGEDLPQAEGADPNKLRQSFARFCEDHAMRVLAQKKARNDGSSLKVPEVVAAAKVLFLEQLDLYHRAKSADYTKRRIEDTKIAGGGKAAPVTATQKRDGSFQSKQEADEYFDSINLDEP